MPSSSLSHVGSSLACTVKTGDRVRSHGGRTPKAQKEVAGMTKVGGRESCDGWLRYAPG